jgi:hypothetical protein
MGTMRTPCCVFAILLAATDARAGGPCSGLFAVNAMVGPVVGIRLGGHSEGIVGLEGGVGCGPERVNAGIELRSRKRSEYLELDPWFIVGGSLGIAFDEDGQRSPLVGIWEGLPLADNTCSGPRDANGESTPTGPGAHQIISISAGYRYTGVHELYATVKAGAWFGTGECIHF